MHIVHLITRFNRGGAEENTQITCDLQVRDGHEVTLIVGEAWEPGMRARLDPRVRFLVEPDLVREVAPLRDLKALLGLSATLRRLKPDVVHTHTSKAGIVGRMAARLSGDPLIVHGVHILSFIGVRQAERLAYTALERFCGQFTHAFVHVSATLKRQCEVAGVGRGSLHVVAESAMDVARFHAAEPPEDAEVLCASPTGESERPFVILMMGLLEPRKRPRPFLRVFRKLVDLRPNTVLLLAGEGVEREAIEADVRELGLERHVRVLGYREDPDRLLVLADATVLCSLHEGLPRVGVQSAISATPIVTTALPGIDQIVTDGVSGFVIPVDDLDAMLSPLQRLADEPELRARMSAALAAGDYSAWSSETMVARIGQAYEEALRRRGRPPAGQDAGEASTRTA